jgi:anti-sigma regulatory factor (Ser/Thr protein kinase)
MAAARRERVHAGEVADELVLAASKHAPRTVRHWVMRAVAAEGVVGPVNQVIELLTAELVSNAVQHGAPDGDVRIAVRIGRGAVRVCVTDEGDGWPQVRRPEITALDGRGLVLVEALSSSWGVVAEVGGGKTTWFEVGTVD